VILGILLIIAGTTFVDDGDSYQMLPLKTRTTNAEAIPVGEVPAVISDQTYKLHGNINCGEAACEGYTLKLRGSHTTASVKQLGQYLFEDMPIGHNIIEVYDEEGNYIDAFEIVFNEGYANAVDHKNNRIYIDLNDTNRALAFHDKYQVSFGIDDAGKIHFNETGPNNTIVGDMEFVSLDKTVNLYGQIVNKTKDSLPDIKIEVDNTDISCITGSEGDFLLSDVPIRNQRLNFYDANGEFISGVEILFNIDGGDICLNSLNKMIIDVGNSDGRLFANMQIGFRVDLDNRTLSYDKDNIHGNVESAENILIYAIICIMFALAFFFAMIVIDRKQSIKMGSIEITDEGRCDLPG
jgi:hypothetical protein